MHQLIPFETFPEKFGRHINHDPRSRAFPANVPDVPLKDKKHRLYGSVLDQGQLGSCTGNAAVQALNHKPFFKGRRFNESDAVSVYSYATTLDPFDGSYPPDDTGSDGTSVAKVLRNRGLITEFRHIFGGVEEAKRIIQVKPFIVGVNFYRGMYNAANMEPTGDLMGGHEMVISGWTKARGFRLLNSWGTGWGYNGYGWMSEDSLAFLLAEDGDATVFEV